MVKLNDAEGGGGGVQELKVCFFNGGKSNGSQCQWPQEFFKSLPSESKRVYTFGRLWNEGYLADIQN